MTVFMKICAKIFFTQFVGYFLLINTKMKMKMKSNGKMKPIFQLSISKLGYVAIFMKI